MSRTVKIGIVGAGTIGTVHAGAFGAVRGVEVAAVSEIDAGKLQAAGEQFKVARLFADYREMLASDIDAVVVAVGNTLHKQVAVAALQAGKHVLLEKPMAMNAGEAAAIVRAARQAKRVLQLGMVNRQNPACRLVRDHVQRGVFGKIYHLRATLIRRRGIPGLGGWFTTKAQSGGGPMIDIGVHYFDLAMWLSGLWQPTSVSAMTYAKFGKNMRQYRYVNMWAGPPRYDGVCDVEDYATGMVRFGRAATLTFEIAWAANCREENFVEILGDKAGARLLDGKPLTILTEQGEQIVDVAPQFNANANLFESQAQSFAARCRGETPAEPYATGEEGVTMMKVIDAVYASGRTGRETRIAP
jgi:predicted dehydrogenase